MPEEFRVEYVADRSQTVGTAFMGLTMECCRCHDHKYDPLTQREYYQLFSFFNNIDEAGLYSFFTPSVPTPTLTLPTDDQAKKLTEAEDKVAAAEAAFLQVAAAARDAVNPAEAANTLRQRIATVNAESPLIAGQVAELTFDDGSYSKNVLVDSPRGKAVQLTGDHGIDVKVGNFARWQPFSVSTWLRAPKSFERSVVFHRSRAWTDAASRGYELLIEDGHLSAALIHFWPGNAIRVRSVEPLKVNKWQHVTVTYDGSSKASGLKLWLDGKPLATDIVRDQLTRNITGGGGDTINIGQRFRDKGFAKGQVDDFRVFDRELTAVEVSLVFSSVGSLSAQLSEARQQLRPNADDAAASDDNFRYEAVIDTLDDQQLAPVFLDDKFEVPKQLPRPAGGSRSPVQTARWPAGNHGHARASAAA